MTFDKYVAIKWPHKSAMYSTPRRAKEVILTIIICVSMYIQFASLLYYNRGYRELLRVFC